MSSRKPHILFATFLLLWLPQAAHAQGPPQGGPGAGSATVISKAVPDLTNPAMPQILIHGQGLGTGDGAGPPAQPEGDHHVGYR